jgi:hypothetical protein
MVYKVDRTHMGIRVSVLLIFLVGLVAGFSAAANLLANLPNFDSLLRGALIAAGSIGMAMGCGSLGERFLTERWPSGRSLHITDEGIMLYEKSDETRAIRWANKINILSWRFVIRKGRAWVSKGSYCVACQIRQDDAMIIPYSFIKPSDATEFPGWSAFVEVLPRKSTPKQDQEAALSEIGRQAQLRYAEQDRWQSGVEMMPADFVQMITELQRRVPEWTNPG